MAILRSLDTGAGKVHAKKPTQWQPVPELLGPAIHKSVKIRLCKLSA